MQSTKGKASPASVYPAASAVAYRTADGKVGDGLAAAIEAERLAREAKERRAKLEKASPAFKLEVPEDAVPKKKKRVNPNKPSEPF